LPSPWRCTPGRWEQSLPIPIDRAQTAMSQAPGARLRYLTEECIRLGMEDLGTDSLVISLESHSMGDRKDSEVFPTRSVLSPHRRRRGKHQELRQTRRRTQRDLERQPRAFSLAAASQIRYYVKCTCTRTRRLQKVAGGILAGSGLSGGKGERARAVGPAGNTVVDIDQRELIRRFRHRDRSAADTGKTRSRPAVPRLREFLERSVQNVP
jgi:hypothetical protein